MVSLGISEQCSGIADNIYDPAVGPGDAVAQLLAPLSFIMFTVIKSNDTNMIFLMTHAAPGKILIVH